MPAPGTVASKQAQAQQVLAQIQQIDDSLGAAVESYNLANVQLAEDRERPAREPHAVEARAREPEESRRTRSRRGSSAPTRRRRTTRRSSVLLGATSLDDLLSRIEADQLDVAAGREHRPAGDVVQGGRPASPDRVAQGARLSSSRSSHRRRRSGSTSSRSWLRAGSCSRRSKARSPDQGGRGSAAAAARAAAQPVSPQRRLRRRDGVGVSARRRPRARPSLLRTSTAASSGSRCATSACRTSGAARRRAASTAPGLVMYVVRPDRRLGAAQLVLAVRYGHAGLDRPAAAGRPRLLLRREPRRASTSAAASSSTRRTRATS